MFNLKIVAFPIVIRCLSATVGLRLLRGKGWVQDERKRHYIDKEHCSDSYMQMAVQPSHCQQK